MLLGSGFLPMFAGGGGAGKQVWDFAAGMPAGASILRSGGNATYFDATGVMQVVSGSDTARRNYNPSTLAFAGLYVERAATNRFSYSDQLDNAAWLKVRGTVTGNVTTAPTSTAVADQFTSNSGSTLWPALYQAIPVSIGQQYSLSCYTKAATRTYIVLRENSGADKRTWFNLASGSVGTSDGGTTSIEPVNIGFYRVTLTYTAASSITVNQTFYTAATDNSSTVPDNSGYLYIFGVQFETGAQTSYIPTTSVAVTRNAESLVLQSVAASSLRVTFDDNSTQDIGVTPGTVTIAAAALNRSLVRKVEEL